MTVDDRKIGKDLAYLQRLFIELEEAKYLRPKRPDIRVMAPPQGPRAPGNSAAVHLDKEIEPELLAWCLNFHDEIGEDEPLPKPPEGSRDPRAPLLAEWASLKSFYIAEHLDVDAFTEDLRRWISAAEKIVGRDKDAAELAAMPEKRHDAKHMVRLLSKCGWVVSEDLIRKWAERGHITRVTRPDGKAGYLRSEVWEYLQSREKETP